MKRNARKNSFSNWSNIEGFISFIMILALFTSCVGDGGRKGRPFIKDFYIGTGATSTCEATYRLSDASCASVCPGIDVFTTHVATDAEIVTANSTVQADTSLSDDEKTIVLKSIATASDLCLEGSGVERPSDAIFVKKDFCSCVNGKRDIVNNCDQFCATKTESVATLFGSVSLGPAVELNEQLGNLSNWCNIEINEQTGPACTLEVFDGSNTQQLTLDIPVGSNTFSVNISSLTPNKTFVARIVESSSGSNASSDSFQIYRIPQDDGTTPINSPLKILPTSMYSCIFRDGTSGNDNNFENAAKVHYFFASNATPPPMPANNVFDICHDVNTSGTIDSPLTPRLELIPQHMALWDFSDIRFADVNPSDGISDVNSLISQKLIAKYNDRRDVNLFGLLPWQNYPLASENPNLGFIMQAFIDPQSGRGFCPGQDEYNNSTDNLFRVLKEIVGIDTEGLFMSEREPIVIPDGNGGFNLAPDDYLMVREGQLKKIWFYFENNQHFVPDEITSSSKTIHFYWPPDETNPYVKKSSQQIYTVRAPEDLGQGGATSGLNTSIRPPDKRFACIPRLD